MDGTSLRKHVKRVIIASQEPRGFARRAQDDNFYGCIEKCDLLSYQQLFIISFEQAGVTQR